MAAETTATAAKTAAASTTDRRRHGGNEQADVPDKPTLATAFIGRSVYSSNDPESETIGDVNDLIIGEDGSITDAVIGVGGFLGIGEKNVAVPFDELQVVESDGDIRLIYAATREQLEAAPAVDLAAYDPAARYSEQQAAMNPDTAADNGCRHPGDGAAGTAAPAADRWPPARRCRPIEPSADQMRRRRHLDGEQLPHAPMPARSVPPR